MALIITRALSSNIIETGANMVECAIAKLVKFIGAHQTIFVHVILIDNALDIM
ncbi:hypothetical protein Tco_1530099, partial [Tanacetum coccineum]